MNAPEQIGGDTGVQLHELRIEATPGLSVERTAFQPQNSLKLFKILKLSNPLHVSPAKRVFIETSNTTVAVAVVVRQGAIFSRLRKCAQAPSEPAPDSHSSPSSPFGQSAADDQYNSSHSHGDLNNELGPREELLLAVPL